MKLIRKTRNKKPVQSTIPTETMLPWTVLVVDDEPDIHKTTRLSLKHVFFAGRSITLLNAYSAQEARAILADHSNEIAVALIDVVMETDDAGLKLVEYIRNSLHNEKMRLIIRTGQPGIAPEREVIDNYDIDDYKDKTELTARKLYTALRTALKAYRDILAIDANRAGLEKILEAAPGLYRTQPLENFFEGVLTQVIGLCELGGGALISSVNGLLITPDTEGENLMVQCGTGIFRTHDAATPKTQRAMEHCLVWLRNSNRTEELLGPHEMLIPLEIHGNPVGFVYIEDTKELNYADRHLLRVMANQCASALESIRLHEGLESAHRDAIWMLSVAAEKKDGDTGDHVKRIAYYTVRTARALGCSDDEAEKMGVSSMMHDVGKLGIPDSILQKPDKLTSEEYRTMQTHPKLGVDILGDNPWFSMAREIALGHHERWDGGGYPAGLKGEEIPLVARIVAVADVFDALVSVRPYKKSWSRDQSIAVIRNGAGTHFDPRVVSAFVNLYEQGCWDDVEQRHHQWSLI